MVVRNLQQLAVVALDLDSSSSGHSFNHPSSSSGRSCNSLSSSSGCLLGGHSRHPLVRGPLPLRLQQQCRHSSSGSSMVALQHSSSNSSGRQRHHLRVCGPRSNSSSA